MKKQKKLKLHEKCPENYTFVDNCSTNKNMDYLKNINYIIGKCAYDLYGYKLDQNYMLPLFIADKDLLKYDKILMDEFNKIKKEG